MYDKTIGFIDCCWKFIDLLIGTSVNEKSNKLFNARIFALEF